MQTVSRKQLKFIVISNKTQASKDAQGKLKKRTDKQKKQTNKTKSNTSNVSITLIASKRNYHDTLCLNTVATGINVSIPHDTNFARN